MDSLGAGWKEWVFSVRKQLFSRLRKIKRSGHISRSSVARAERLQAKPCLDQLQNRRRVVLGVIDKALLGKRPDHKRRNARTWSPAVDFGRRDMIPQPAVLVVGDDDQAVLPQIALLYHVDQIARVVLARCNIGIARMFVILAQNAKLCMAPAFELSLLAYNVAAARGCQ